MPSVERLLAATGGVHSHQTQTIAMNDTQVALVFGVAGSGEKTVVAPVLFVDPESSGASEDLLLPPEASATGVWLEIHNTGGENIELKEDSDTTTIATIYSGDSVHVRCNGTTWYDTGARSVVELDGAADALVLDADGDTTLSSPTDDQIDVEIGGADDFRFTANTFTALSGSTIATDTIAETTTANGVSIDGVVLKDTTVDVNGTADAIILDADADTTISAPTDDQIDIECGGADVMTFTNEGMIRPAGKSDMSHRNRVVFFEDFFPVATTTEINTYGFPMTIDVDGAGPPTQDYVNDAANGEYLFTTEATSERQGLLVKPMGDQLLIDLTKNPVLEVRLKISPAGATFTADERVAVGLCGAFATAETSLDNIDHSVFFRMEGANLNILVEADDASTDTDDQDSTIDYVKGTYFTLRMDLSNLSDIKFYVDGVEQGGGTVAAASLTGNVQPVIVHQRDAGTEVNTVTIDYVYCEWDRV